MNMTQQEKHFLKTGEKIKDAVKSQLFGKPCFKINKKAFCCFFQNEMVFKLTGDSHSDALSLDGSQLFDPSGKGRPMKEWVQIPFDYKEKYEVFSKNACDYVREK